MNLKPEVDDLDAQRMLPSRISLGPSAATTSLWGMLRVMILFPPLLSPQGLAASREMSATRCRADQDSSQVQRASTLNLEASASQLGSGRPCGGICVKGWKMISLRRKTLQVKRDLSVPRRLFKRFLQTMRSAFAIMASARFVESKVMMALEVLLFSVRAVLVPITKLA